MLALDTPPQLPASAAPLQPASRVFPLTTTVFAPNRPPSGTFHTAEQAAVAHDVMELWRNESAQVRWHGCPCSPCVASCWGGLHACLVSSWVPSAPLCSIPTRPLTSNWLTAPVQGLNFASPAYTDLLPLLKSLSEVRRVRWWSWTSDGSKELGLLCLHGGWFAEP